MTKHDLCGAHLRIKATNLLLTITWKSRLTPKQWHKKTMLFLASMGETGLSHDISFSNSQLGLSRSLRSNDLRWWNFEAATSKFCDCSWKLGSSPRKVKVDLCMTNCSKVLIYLTLLNFLLHYLQEYSKIWNVAK